MAVWKKVVRERSGKSQGILELVREIGNFEKSQGILELVREIWLSHVLRAIMQRCRELEKNVDVKTTVQSNTWPVKSEA